jgi:hypothetical protein
MPVLRARGHILTHGISTEKMSIYILNYGYSCYSVLHLALFHYSALGRFFPAIYSITLLILASKRLPLFILLLWARQLQQVHAAILTAC